MDEQLKQAILCLLEKVNSGTDFAIAEIPDALHQLMRWEAVESLFIIGIWITLFLVLRSLLPKFVEKVSSNPGEDVACTKFIVDFFGGIIVAVIITVNSAWLQIWIAPKAWLIEYLRELI